MPFRGRAGFEGLGCSNSEKPPYDDLKRRKGETLIDYRIRVHGDFLHRRETRIIYLNLFSLKLKYLFVPCLCTKNAKYIKIFGLRTIR